MMPKRFMKVSTDGCESVDDHGAVSVNRILTVKWSVQPSDVVYEHDARHAQLSFKVFGCENSSPVETAAGHRSVKTQLADSKIAALSPEMKNR